PLHLTGPALRFFATPSSLQPARQVKGVVRREGESSYGVVREASARDYEARRSGPWRPGTRRTFPPRRGEAASSETAPGACRLLADLHQRRGTRLLRRELGAGWRGEADPRPNREPAARCRDVAPTVLVLRPGVLLLAVPLGL